LQRGVFGRRVRFGEGMFILNVGTELPDYTVSTIAQKNAV